MECPTCNQDREPIIEGEPGPGGLAFFYTCGNPGCHAKLGPVQREHTVPKVVPSQPLLATPPPIPNGPGVTMIADVGGSLVDMMRARIEVLDRELAKAEVIRKERTMLARMLRAAERKEKAEKRSNVNVVPFAVGATSGVTRGFS